MYSLKNHEIMQCKCSQCEHELKAKCIYENCQCCSIEDEFALLTKQEVMG